MSHRILGFIAKHSDLCRAAAGLPGARVAPLRVGFGFLPLTEELAGEDEPAPFQHLERLTSRLSAWAEAQSRQFPIVYIETDYFGGVGIQAAIAWEAGQVVFGPAQTPEQHPDDAAGSVLDRGVINRTVRHLGVSRAGFHDEFDALGLGDHRSNEKWLAVALPPGPEAM
jgi:hypothetical protein